MTKLILVHGYNHDPSVPDHDPGRAPFTLGDDDMGGQFPFWERMMRGRECVRFPWFSAIHRRPRDIWQAWRAGHRTTYGWAYGVLAVDAAHRLNEKVRHMTGGPVDILCHSLGVRVALLAVSMSPKLYRKVLMLNGAETNAEAEKAFRSAPLVDFLNVGAYEDDIVEKLGGWFAPNLGKEDCLANGFDKDFANVEEVILDDPQHQKYFKVDKGWDLRGDNPDSMGDHSYSFLWEGNWPLYQEFLLN